MTNKSIVLIVDDEPINIDMIAEILHTTYELKVANDGLQALNILEKTRVDLVLLDINMPNLNGYEVAAEIIKRDNFSDIPFIFLTSHIDNDSIIKGFKSGAKDYITKPFNLEELKVRVANHLQINQLQKQLKMQEKFFKQVLNTQPSMILITDGKTIEFGNQALLNYYDMDNIDDFIKKYRCICNTFVRHDNYFHLGKIPEDVNWIEEVIKLPQEKRIVSIVSNRDSKGRVFSLAFNKFDETKYIINVNDISSSFLIQLELMNKTHHDKLTNAFSREYFETHIDQIITKNNLNDYMTGIAFIDIDYFKKVNDTYGHEVGDNVLKTLVHTINNNSRVSDVLIRWGGEEFIMVLAVKTEAHLHKILDALRHGIEEKKIDIVQQITISIGATLYKENESIEECINRADKALYESKNNGRNRVSLL